MCITQGEQPLENKGGIKNEIFRNKGKGNQ